MVYILIYIFYSVIHTPYTLRLECILLERRNNDAILKENQ